MLSRAHAPRPVAATLAALLAVTACTRRRLEIVPHAAWQASPPVGYAADAVRRNRAAGDTLAFHDLTIRVLATSIDSSGGRPVDVVQLRLTKGDTTEVRPAREGAAFNWRGHHVAIYGARELGAGLVALEVGALASLPSVVARSDSAGGAAMRLRIPHRIGSRHGSGRPGRGRRAAPAPTGESR